MEMSHSYNPYAFQTSYGYPRLPFMPNHYYCPALPPQDSYGAGGVWITYPAASFVDGVAIISEPPIYTAALVLVDGETLILEPPTYTGFVDQVPFTLEREPSRVSSYDYEELVYEELLELVERMGRVNVGLSQETISRHLKTETAKVEHCKEEAEADICVVCQCEYECNEMVATLDCGHCYHSDCINKWLLLKNECPVCKSEALIV